MIRSNRIRRAALRQRAAINRAAARIRRRGTASLTTHALAAGLPIRQARSVGSTLRKVAAKLGIHGVEGRAHTGRRMRTTTRFTPAQVAVIAHNYKARKPAYRIAAVRLALAA